MGLVRSDGLAVCVADGAAVGRGLAGVIVRMVAVGLGVAVLEQATAVSIRATIEPIRARRPVRTPASSVICIAVEQWVPTPLGHQGSSNQLLAVIPFQ